MRGRSRINRGLAGAMLASSVLAAAWIAVAAADSGSRKSPGSTTAIARAMHATTSYRDIAVARRAGYALLKDANGVACIEMTGMPKMGAMGIHYAKSALVGDGAVEVTRPEALVYEPGADGKRHLVALEYVVVKSAWDAHHSARPSLFGHTFNFTPSGNRYGLPAFYSLHAWIWKDNPTGMFSMWNPTVSCATA